MKTTVDVPAAIPQVSRILVATDFSVQARNALEWARRLADAFGARLVLFHVINIFSLAEMGCAMEGGIDPLGLVREQSQKCIAELKSQFPDLETMIREGAPRPMIIDAARELNCQLIVMGTHGRSGLAHLLLGSVAEYVVRHSSVPVLTIRLHQK
jgi:nucleotide-binding universal stress UspA family protein